MATIVRNNTNERIYNRFVPSFKPQIQLETRPVQTKYTTMQILDERPRYNVDLENRQLYDVNKQFLPVAYSAPLILCLTMRIKNQCLEINLLLCKSDLVGRVPSSNSDL